MTNEQLAAYLYQLACRLNIELINLESCLTPKQERDSILTPVENIVLELKAQVEMLTGNDCPTV